MHYCCVIRMEQCFTRKVSSWLAPLPFQYHVGGYLLPRWRGAEVQRCRGVLLWGPATLRNKQVPGMYVESTNSGKGLPHIQTSRVTIDHVQGTHRCAPTQGHQWETCELYEEVGWLIGKKGIPDDTRLLLFRLYLRELLLAATRGNYNDRAANSPHKTP